jgi:transcriptional regulator with XRE-family HTH domain
MQFTLSSASPAAIVAFALEALKEREPDLTMQAWAEELNVTNHWLSRVLRFRRRPNQELAEKLAARLGIPKEIFTGKKSEHVRTLASTSNSYEN